ncbi:MAG TPA: FkbM family methyltransferase [Flavobacterium sp.]|nr:FkbM family methyltransferase [Flavobacterium sp.]
MRRFKILFFWIFINRNNVSFSEMLNFLFKPTINILAKKYVQETIEGDDDVKVVLKGYKYPLYWPKSFSFNRLDQVVCETFDSNDWHYYQKEHTEIKNGEHLLDIGTAEGLFPLTVQEMCTHIYLIEPGKTFNATLNKTFEPIQDKITIYNVAVGNEDGEIMFSEDSLDGKITNGTEANSEKITICRIDTLMKDKKVTYLKADIEGFEQEMLKGAAETIIRNKPKIAITTYHDQNNPDEIITLIKSYVPEYNYYVKGIYEKTPKPVLIHFWI